MRAAIAEHSLADVAAVAGISKARVHQIVRAADRHTATYPSDMARTASREVRREAAAILRRLIAAVDRGELHAPAWFVERLRGVMLQILPDPWGETPPGVNSERSSRGG